MSISIKKFINLLNNHNYKLISLYCIQEDKLLCKFIEAKSPNDKTLFIRSSRYTIIIPDDIEENIIFIKKLVVSEVPSDQLDYLTILKSSFTELDITCLSENILICFMNDGLIEYYSIQNESENNESEEEKTEDDYDENNKVLEIEKSLKQLQNKLGLDEDKKTKTIVPDTEDKIELIFDNDQNIKENDINKNTEEIGEEEETDITNIDIDQCMVYITVDIKIFFKRVKEFENELLEMYDELDKNEYNLRDKKVDNINNLIYTIKEKIENQISDIKNRESDIKEQLHRLNIILITSEDIEKKISIKKNQSLFIIELQDIKNIISNTKELVEEMNMEFIKLRDEANNILTSAKIYLQDFLL